MIGMQDLLDIIMIGYEEDYLEEVVPVCNLAMRSLLIMSRKDKAKLQRKMDRRSRVRTRRRAAEMERRR